MLGRELTVIAHRVGVNDASGSVPGVQGGPGVTEALDWMASERLGPWAPGGMVNAQRVASTIELDISGMSRGDRVERARRSWTSAARMDRRAG